MKSPTITRHEFVEYIPDELDERVLYVSIRFATAVHLCYCGCGSEVVTPLSPTGWQVLFDGTSVTVYPSIGSWGLKCRSHYWIDHGVVRWARTWSDHEIVTARRRDTRDKELEFEFKISTDTAIEPFVPAEEDSRPASIWRQAVRRLFGRAGVFEE